MAFNKITNEDIVGLGVTGLADVPGLSTADMQAQFDEYPEYLKERINQLIDELKDAAAASDIGTAKGTLQAVLNEIEQNLSGKASADNILTKDNTEPYTPIGDYNPATKKFVTDTLVEIGAGDMRKAVYDANGNGTVDDAEKLGGMLPAYYASAEMARRAKETADAAMPKAGGTFTDNAVAAATTDEATAMLRNIVVVEADTDLATLSVPAGTIIMQKK